MNYFEKFAALVFHYRRAIYVGCTLLFLAMLPFAARVTPDNSLEAISVVGDSNIVMAQRVEALFGSEEYITIAFEADDILNAKSLQIVDELSRYLQSQTEMEQVLSLSTIWKLKNEKLGNESGLHILPFLDPVWIKTGVPLAERKSLLNVPLYKTLIYNDSSTATAILGQLKPLNDQQKSILINRVRQFTSDLTQKTGVKVHIFGLPVINRAIYETIEKEQFTLTPLMILAITLLIIYLYRNLYITIVTLFQFLMTLGVVMGFLGIMHVHLNWLTAFAPAVMMIMSLCDAVYVINEFQNADYSLPPLARLKQVYKNIAAPCLFTSITNAFGFASLISSPVRPLQEYGLYVTLAVLVEYLITFTIFPLLLNTPRSQKNSSEKKQNPFLKSLLAKAYHLVIYRSKEVAGICVLLAGLSIIGMTYLQANQSSLGLFKTDRYGLNEANDFVKKGVGGGIETHVLFDTEQSDILLEPKHLLEIEQLEKEDSVLIPSINKSISLVDYVKYFNQAWHDDDPAYYKVPKTQEEVAQLVLLMEMDADRLNLRQFVTADYSKGVSRIFSRVNNTLQDSLVSFDTAIKLIDRIFGGSISAHGTSQSYVTSLVIRRLPETVIFSLGTSVIFIGLAMMGLMRSVYVGFLSMLPNLLPIMMIMGIMGYFNIWINIATAMTFAVSLGIAMDDTINIIWRMKKYVVEQGMTYEEALKKIYDKIGIPLISSSLLLAGGYMMLSFSQLWPTTAFGMFVALCCIFALISDLLLTPLLFLKLKPFKVKK